MTMFLAQECVALDRERVVPGLMQAVQLRPRYAASMATVSAPHTGDIR